MIAMRYGLARGIYANEAGYGTAAVAYGTARSDRPAQQGLNAVMEVFIVSFVTSTISALTHPGQRAPGARDRPARAVVAQAFNAAMPAVGGWILAFCVFLFGYTTLIGWAYYGEQFLEYVLRHARHRALPLDLLRADRVRRRPARSTTVWAWGDLMNGLQIFPNLVGVWSALGRGRGRPCGTRAGQPPRGMSGFARDGGRPAAATACRSRTRPRAFGTPLYVYSAAAVARRLPRLRPRVRRRAAPRSATR